MILLRTALTLALFTLLISSFGCQKESESIVSIALHPTNANILYVAMNDAIYKSCDGGHEMKESPHSARDLRLLARGNADLPDYVNVVFHEGVFP